MPRAGLADEIGIAQLSMGLLAERLGVRTPSLCKHVSSQADLAHRIAILAMTELGDSFTWMITFIDHGLRATTSTPSPAAPHALTSNRRPIQ